MILFAGYGSTMICPAWCDIGRLVPALSREDPQATRPPWGALWTIQSLDQRWAI